MPAGHTAAMTVWSMLEMCVSQLDEPFGRSEIVGWFRRHHPEVKESTLGAHIQAATANAANRAQNNALGARAPLLSRIDRGLYVRAVRSPESAAAAPAIAAGTQETGNSPADVVLIGCVRTKRATPSAAAELFVSPLFEGRRRYAVAAGRPWFILSAKFGLLDPADVIGPYDVYLAGQSAAYRRAWGKFVAAQLAECERELRGCTVEVHAGAAYLEPLQAPLAGMGATIVTPLAHLSIGQQLAWYNSRSRPGWSAVPAPAAAGLADGVAADLAPLLSDPERAQSPRDLLALGAEARP